MLKRKLLVANAAAVVILFGVLAFNWWSGRPVDYSSPHGDECLEEPQGLYERCWDIFVPESSESDPLALVIDLHALGGTPSGQRNASRMGELAKEKGFVAVWPAGLDESWNAGGNGWPDPAVIDPVVGSGCCGPSLNAKTDDVEFLLAMVSQIRQEIEIDPDRVFLFGHSNGCFMAQRAVAESGGVFGGLACTSGFLLIDPTASYEPVPILLMHGTGDGVVEYQPSFWTGAVANVSKWASANGCVGEPVSRFTGLDDPPRSETFVWLECQNDAPVRLISVPAGHNLYLNSGNPGAVGSFDPARAAWTFLNQPS